MNKKIIYEKIVIAIAIGASSFSESQTFRKGVCTGVKIVPISPLADVVDELNVNVTDGSNTILGATDFRDFIPNGGGYEEGFKPCFFESDLKLTVDAVSPTNIATSNFKAQLIFKIEVDCN